MPRSTLNIDAYNVPVPGFTQAVVVPAASRFVFVSGLTSRGADGTVLHPGDIEGQTRAVLDSLRRILAAVGAELDDVVRIVTYLRRIDDHPKVHAVRRQYFGDSPPASTTVEVSRLYDAEQLIELEATAVLPEGTATP
jgi:enamine deaminase RidA (YjgF/YER057c/UK114 family)